MRRPFPLSSESDAFMKSFAEEVSKVLKLSRSHFVSEDNVHSFRHGTRWQSHNSYKPDEISSLQQHSNEIVVEKIDVVEYRVDVLLQMSEQLAANMSRDLAQTMYATLSDVCKENDQIVDANGQDFANSLIALLEKVDCGVDREGNPTLPSFHMHPDSYRAMRNNPIFEDASFKKKVDEITERKKSEAHQREQRRVDRFKRASNDA